MRAVARIFASIAFVSIAGCAIDANSNTHGTPCTGMGQGTCVTGQTCYRGFCVSGGTMDVGMVDGGVDAPMPMPDTGIDSAVDGGADAGFDSAIDAGRDASDVGTDTSPDADDHCEAGGTACTTGQLGECSAGHRSCGLMGCVREHDPIAETCNNHDDDCDGIVDEESDQVCFPSTAGGCTQGADGRWTCMGACRTGIQGCVGGGPGACTGGNGPIPEACTTAGQTAVDEDCDGMVDETVCPCTMGMMRSCFEGPMALAGVGRCTRGSQTCDSSGHWGACIGSGSPMPETCANTGEDDDCDGTDDNVPGIGTACTAMSAMGSCADGMTTCSLGSETCEGPMAVAMEACDFHDDDCDGSTDEDFDVTTDAMNCGMCGHACGAGNACCDSTCTDPSTDESNCGTCGHACTGAANTCCSNSCADTTTDEANCGACGHACSGGQLCCNSTCVDPLSDEANCMGCGNTCSGATSMCCGGCHLPSDAQCTGCPVNCSMQTPVQECCGASGAMQCRDTMTDEANCGSCGHACGTGEVCCGGSCFPNGPAHCGGACGVCAGANPLCCGDACVPSDTRHCTTCGMTCGTGSSCCGDGCHDLRSSDAHCGTCTTACTGAAPHCTNSHCCANGQTYCGNACVDLQTNGSNCGSCGHGCAALYGCRSGACVFLGI